jgi:hypothetical protein
LAACVFDWSNKARAFFVTGRRDGDGDGGHGAAASTSSVLTATPSSPCRNQSGIDDPLRSFLDLLFPMHPRAELVFFLGGDGAGTAAQHMVEGVPWREHEPA